MRTTEFDDLFIKRLQEHCKSLKHEASAVLREAMDYSDASDPSDERLTKAIMISISQAKIECRTRLEELIRMALAVRKDLEGDV